MTTPTRSVCLWLAAAVLAGCFESDQPLLAVADGVTPIPDGEYTMVGDDDRLRVRLAQAGKLTRFTELDAEGEPETSEFLMALLDPGYYIIMDEPADDVRYSYVLARVEGKRLTIFDQSDYCDRLQQLWLESGKTAADAGIVAGRAERVSTCEFKRYEDLARAFRALIADGRMEPSFVLEPVNRN